MIEDLPRCPLVSMSFPNENTYTEHEKGGKRAGRGRKQDICLHSVHTQDSCRKQSNQGSMVLIDQLRTYMHYLEETCTQFQLQTGDSDTGGSVVFSASIGCSPDLARGELGHVPQQFGEDLLPSYTLRRENPLRENVGRSTPGESDQAQPFSDDQHREEVLPAEFGFRFNHGRCEWLYDMA